MSTKITYNGKTTELADGYIATLPCKDLKMETDVVVEAPEESGGSSINVQPLTVTENGTWDAPEGQAYDPVTVDVKPITEPITITENGVYPVPKGAGGTIEFGKEYKFKDVITEADFEAFIAKANPPESLAGGEIYRIGCSYFVIAYKVGDVTAYYMHNEQQASPLYALGMQAIQPTMPADGWWLADSTGAFTQGEPPTVIIDESKPLSADLATTAIFFDIETKSLDGWGDITVNVAPLPIEVSTEAEMTALLESGEVGGVYKYTGTTGTYENGALYVLEEEARVVKISLEVNSSDEGVFNFPVPSGATTWSDMNGVVDETSQYVITTTIDTINPDVPKICRAGQIVDSFFGLVNNNINTDLVRVSDTLDYDNTYYSFVNTHGVGGSGSN